MNYSFTSKFDLPEVEDGHTFEGDNFLQMTKGTKIFEGVSGLTFINCNLTNCIVPDDATVIGAPLKTQSFCSHVHPRWVAKGLPECAEDCEHMNDEEDITIDGVKIATHREYSDKAGI